MHLLRRVIIGNRRYMVMVGAVVLMMLGGLFILYYNNSSKSQPIAASNSTPNLDTNGEEKPAPEKITTTKPAPEPTKPAPSSQPAAGITKLSTTAKAGIYNGPGTVGTHGELEQWLGQPIPYATDYIDYKGGWQKDFIDSEVWLIKPWSKWKSANNQRRLVLGVPMLQNENTGQFAQGTRGDFDVYFHNLASKLVTNNLGDSIIRLGYEANCDTIGPWQATNNPEGYRQLFRHIVTVMRSVPGQAFSFDWTVCNGLQQGRALTSFDSFYPGDDVVDIIGMDIYDVKWGDPAATPQRRWDYGVSRRMGVNELVRFAHNHAKAISYPEWGLYKPGDSFAGGGDNPYFIRKMAELIATTDPIYQSYFNLDWGGGKLSDFKQGGATYRQLFGK